MIFVQDKRLKTITLLVLFMHMVMMFYSWKNSQVNTSTNRLNSQVVTKLNVINLIKNRMEFFSVPKKLSKNSHKVSPNVVEDLVTSKVSSIAPEVIARRATLKEIYLAELREKMDNFKNYPVISRRLGETGTVKIGFNILADGNFSNIKLVQSSGHQRLDHEAMDILAKMGKYKMIPSELELEMIEVIVPIKFELL